MSETKNKPSRSIYYGLFYEFFRAFTIPTVALSGALVDFYCKNFFIPSPVTHETSEEKSIAEEKFKKTIFADPTRTEKTIADNPGKAEEIAKFAQFNGSDLFGKKSVQKTFNPFLFFF